MEYLHQRSTGGDEQVMSGNLKPMVIQVFWPVSTRNYYLWPFLFLIPLMIGDVVTTTFAVRLGYPELNPLLVNIVKNPLHHLALKIAIPVLLLVLCMTLYSIESNGYADGNNAGGILFDLIKFSIFSVIVIDCIIYAGTFLGNTRLIIHHPGMLRNVYPPHG